MTTDNDMQSAATDKPVLILGATSGIGAQAVDEALNRGLRVRGFARGADAMTPRDGLEPFTGDALDPADLTRALDGVGAVIYALGVKERPAMIWQQETLFSRTTAVLIDAMQAAGVSRLVAVTGFGAGRSRDAMSKLEKLGHNAVLGRVYDDKSRQESLIMESSLDWTIARPVILTKGARTGTARVLRAPDEWRNGLISRSDVAAYLVDAVIDGLDIGRDVVLAR
jgi:putative NADH-flavin reductase